MRRFGAPHSPLWAPAFLIREGRNGRLMATPAPPRKKRRENRFGRYTMARFLLATPAPRAKQLARDHGFDGVPEGAPAAPCLLREVGNPLLVSRGLRIFLLRLEA